MKKTILVIALLLSTLNVLKAQKLDIIPRPVSIEQKEKVFVIPVSVQLIIDKKVQKSANYIESNFLKNTGITPTVSIGHTHRNKAIQLLVDENMNLPNDGYKLRPVIKLK